MQGQRVTNTARRYLSTRKRAVSISLMESDLPSHFGNVHQNIGLLLGEPSGGLIDVDLDSTEALALAPILLPDTDCIFGRQSKQGSHRLDIASPLVNTVKFQSPASAAKMAKGQCWLSFGLQVARRSYLLLGTLKWKPSVGTGAAILHMLMGAVCMHKWHASQLVPFQGA